MTKLCPRFIGPIAVVAKKGLAYRLNLTSILRTHPLFYVGFFKPYRDPSHVNLEVLTPRNMALPSSAASESTSKLILHPGSAQLQCLDAGLTRLQWLNTVLRHIELPLGLTQCLSETTQLKDHFLMLLPRYTDHHRRFSMSKVTTSFM